MLEPGATLGRFAIEHPLGLGETSTVYLARDLASARGFALKLYSLPFEPLDADRRFVEELSSTAPEAIVRMFAIGRHESHPFVVMELVEGVPLSAFIERRLTVALGERLRWLQALCAAVAYLHERGVVHGRVTPGRIIVTDRGQLKLLGLPLPAVPARDRGRPPDIDVPYLAPERIRGETASLRADVFAIGAIGYELLTYAAPFGADAPDAIAARVVSENPIPLPEINPDVPLALAELIDKALAKDPSVRFPDAVSLNGVLRSIPTEPPTTRPSSALARAAIRRPPEDVQFTVYRPRAVRPGEWRRLLAFMHLAEQRPDAPAEEPSPLEKVKDLADQTLGKEAKQFGHATADGRLAVPREGEITLIPVVEGVEFDPERRTFRWVEDVHQETFRLRARPEAEGTTVRGRMAAYLGVFLLAQVDISIRVDTALGTDPASHQQEPNSANAYRRIFASYSRLDWEIVRQFELFVEALGDRYLIDVRSLPAGADWRAGVRTLIHDADVFQLFWSTNSMRSEHVREECEYALSLKRPAFVRPTYWEEPMPGSPSEGLPPAVLRRLHFHRLCWSAPVVVPAPPRASPIEQVLPEPQMAATLARGWRALDAGDVVAADRAAKEVLLLDPEDRAAVELNRAVEASFAKRQRVVKEHVVEARRALEAGDFERADWLVAELAAVSASTEDVAALREEIRKARHQQEQAHERDRRDAQARVIVQRARQALERGELDAAEAILLEARELGPDAAAARQLTIVSEQLHEERRRIEADRARQAEVARREEERCHAEARQAEERQRAEEQRRAEEAAQRAQAEARRRHEEAARESEARRRREEEELGRMAQSKQESQAQETTASVPRATDITQIGPVPSATAPTLGGPARDQRSGTVPAAAPYGAWRYLAAVALLSAALVLGLWLFVF